MRNTVDREHSSPTPLEARIPHLSPQMKSMPENVTTAMHDIEYTRRPPPPPNSLPPRTSESENMGVLPIVFVFFFPGALGPKDKFVGRRHFTTIN